MKAGSKVRMKKTVVFRAVGTLLALILLVYLLSQQGWNAIVTTVQQIELWRFALAMGLMFISRLAVAGRWHVLLTSAGLEIKPQASTRLTFAGLFASNFLPTTIGGDVVRLAGVIQMKYDGVTAAASLLVDRLVGMFGMMLLLPIFVGKFGVTPLKTLEIGAMSMIALSKGIWNKVRNLIDRLTEALSHWRENPRALLTALLFSGVHMTCLFVSIIVLLAGMGERLSFWTVAGLWSVVYFVTLIPVSINGFGVQEISTSLIFSKIGGVSVQSGLMVAVLIRLITMLASLPGVLFVSDIMTESDD